jgi:hypothetical protein
LAAFSSLSSRLLKYSESRFLLVVLLLLVSLVLASGLLLVLGSLEFGSGGLGILDLEGGH